MGFDVFGLNPKNEKGKYFRNNVWWWRPLADFVLAACKDCFKPGETEHWHSNSGQRVSEETALKITERLKKLVLNGDVKRYEREYNRELKALPDERCKFCNGTGKRDDEYVKGKCNACQGKGKVRPFVTNYPFDERNVLEFIAFCKNSGGFEIW